jgi:DNA-directed RNA polymerase subunit RPC12/RpoP
MDYRCPLCARDLGRHKLGRSIVARMEIDCPYCMRRIRLNMHRAEEALVFATLVAFVLLVALGYWLAREALYVAAVGAALLAALAQPLVERSLPTWPRYGPANSGSGS